MCLAIPTEIKVKIFFNQHNLAIFGFRDYRKDFGQVPVSVLLSIIVSDKNKNHLIRNGVLNEGTSFDKFKELQHVKLCTIY